MKTQTKVYKERVKLNKLYCQLAEQEEKEHIAAKEAVQLANNNPADLLNTARDEYSKSNNKGRSANGTQQTVATMATTLSTSNT